MDKKHFAVNCGEKMLTSAWLKQKDLQEFKQAMPNGSDVYEMQPEEVLQLHRNALRDGNPTAADRWLAVYSEMERADCIEEG